MNWKIFLRVIHIILCKMLIPTVLLTNTDCFKRNMAEYGKYIPCRVLMEMYMKLQNTSRHTPKDWRHYESKGVIPYLRKLVLCSTVPLYGVVMDIL